MSTSIKFETNKENSLYPALNQLTTGPTLAVNGGASFVNNNPRPKSNE